MKKLLNLCLAAAIALPLAANAGCGCDEKDQTTKKDKDKTTALNDKTEQSKKNTVHEAIDADKTRQDITSEIEKGSSKLKDIKKAMPKMTFSR